MPTPVTSMWMTRLPSSPWGSQVTVRVMVPSRVYLMALLPRFMMMWLMFTSSP